MIDEKPEYLGSNVLLIDKKSRLEKSSKVRI